MTTIRDVAGAEAAVVTRTARFLGWSARGEGAANRQRLRALQGKFKGGRCFVMGNGPTLLDCDLNRLSNEITIVSNAHYLIWDRLKYIPTFLTVEDTLVAEDRADELRELQGPTKVFPLDLAHLIGPPRPDTIYVNFHRRYPGFPRFSHHFSRRCYWGGTVSFLNFQLAAYLGCTTIILIGFDHSYAVPTAEVVDHVIESHEKDVNHIHPDYFGPGYRWHDPMVDRMELGYRHARRVLDERGVRVLNATAGGKLEVFERVAFEAMV